MVKLLDLIEEMKCWPGYKKGNPKTKISSRTGERVNNCVPVNEDIIDGEIECEKCGWKWDVVDGGQNPYLCHKCDHDNSNQNSSIQVDEYDVENEDDLREFIEFMKEYQQQLNEATCDCMLEAKYQGRTVPLGKPMRGDSKKFKVYVKNPKTDKVVKVNFGAKGMNIKKNNPKRRKAFRARHNCANPGPRTKARYWSCRKW
jgi:DNA-directed RNA polymerase subunit RPC12/RpoP